MNMSCARCGKVLALEVTIAGEDRTYSAAQDDFTGTRDEFQVEVATPPGGILTAVCLDCITQREALTRMMQLAAQMLQLNEEYVANMEMACERVPALADDPDVKASVALARERAAEARAQLAVLADAEAQLEEES